MGEFSKSWEGWQLLAKPDQALDRVMDPNGGVVLLETGIDAHTVINQVAERVDDFIRQTRSEATHYIHLSPGCKRLYEESYKPLLSGKMAQMGRVARALRDVTDPIKDPIIQFEEAYRRVQKERLFLAVQRRSQLRPTHTDDNVLTTWLGASEPGLRVMLNGEWWRVDDVPVGHVLAWRGDRIEIHDSSLTATRHQAVYRRKKRRVALVGG